ncbi:hypothetical protein BDV96DRAFT_590780 [Lophiotrema nucula]|uniref:Uncharacterized protein n=1 Tax=Lophiotrema nucula TaxID=690887 RepID=A0A6A5YHI3_9PLEO|nr:hypothetical protein BDV96DRAFT_590780 [Lophiotrema nucula]
MRRAASASPGFPDLPGELRVKVYANIVANLVYYRAPDCCLLPYIRTSAYRGLYLSCHEVKAEMDVDCVKLFNVYLSNNAVAQMPAQLSPDYRHPFASIGHLQVEPQFQLEHIWAHPSLIALHLRSLTFSLINHRENDMPTPATRLWEQFRASVLVRLFNTRRIRAITDDQVAAAFFEEYKKGRTDTVIWYLSSIHREMRNTISEPQDWKLFSKDQYQFDDMETRTIFVWNETPGNGGWFKAPLIKMKGLDGVFES